MFVTFTILGQVFLALLGLKSPQGWRAERTLADQHQWPSAPGCMPPHAAPWCSVVYCSAVDCLVANTAHTIVKCYIVWITLRALGN